MKMKVAFAAVVCFVGHAAATSLDLKSAMLNQMVLHEDNDELCALAKQAAQELPVNGTVTPANVTVFIRSETKNFMGSGNILQQVAAKVVTAGTCESIDAVSLSKQVRVYLSPHGVVAYSSSRSLNGFETKTAFALEEKSFKKRQVLSQSGGFLGDSLKVFIDFVSVAPNDLCGLAALEVQDRASRSGPGEIKASLEYEASQPFFSSEKYFERLPLAVGECKSFTYQVKGNGALNVDGALLNTESGTVSFYSKDEVGFIRTFLADASEADTTVYQNMGGDVRLRLASCKNMENIKFELFDRNTCDKLKAASKCFAFKNGAESDEFRRRFSSARIDLQSAFEEGYYGDLSSAPFSSNDCLEYTLTNTRALEKVQLHVSESGIVTAAFMTSSQSKFVQFDLISKLKDDQRDLRQYEISGELKGLSQDSNLFFSVYDGNYGRPYQPFWDPWSAGNMLTASLTLAASFFMML